MLLGLAACAGADPHEIVTCDMPHPDGKGGEVTMCEAACAVTRPSVKTCSTAGLPAPCGAVEFDGVFGCCMVGGIPKRVGLFECVE